MSKFNIHSFFILLVSCFVANSLFGQAPDAMKYQAIVRDAAGATLINQSVGFEAMVHQGTPTGTVVYQESVVLTTNAIGLITRNIGEANLPQFGAINWENGPYFLETKIDPNGGSNYTIQGTSQLFSVPYALYANRSLLSDSAKYATEASYVSQVGFADSSEVALFSDTAFFAFQTAQADLANHALSADSSDHADRAVLADHAFFADSAGHAILAHLANHAFSSDSAGHANLADFSLFADSAYFADQSRLTEHAFTADSSDHADLADHATSSDSSDHADLAEGAFLADHSITSDTSLHAFTSDHALSSNMAAFATLAAQAMQSDSANHATTANLAVSATHANTATTASFSAFADSSNYADSTHHAAYSDTAKFAYNNYGDYAVFEHRLSNGQNGPNMNNNNWLTRILNTTVTNSGTSITLSSNVITLQPGKYEVRASATVYDTRRYQIRLWDLTNSITTLLGTSAYGNSDNENVWSSIDGYFEISSTTDFLLQSNHENGSQWGRASQRGVDEVYARIVIHKIQ